MTHTVLTHSTVVFFLAFALAAFLASTFFASTRLRCFTFFVFFHLFPHFDAFGLEFGGRFFQRKLLGQVSATIWTTVLIVQRRCGSTNQFPMTVRAVAVVGKTEIARLHPTESHLIQCFGDLFALIAQQFGRKINFIADIGDIRLIAGLTEKGQ